MRKIIRKWTSLIGILLAIVLAMGIFTPEIFAANYVYYPQVKTCTDNGGSTYNGGTAILRLCVEPINGSTATFVVTKIDGTNFQHDGNICLKIDGTNHFCKPVNSGVPQVTLDDDLALWASANPTTANYSVSEQVPEESGTTQQIWVGPITITRVPNKLPTVSIANCQSVINEPSYTFKWSGYDPDGYIARYYISLDGGSKIDVGTATSYEWKNLSKGDHTFSVQAQDNLGDYSTIAECIFKVNSSPTQPIINCPTSVVTTSDYPFNWSSYDPDGDSLQYYYGLENTNPDSLTITNSYTWNNLSNGNHTFSVKARDRWGAESPIAICNFKVELPAKVEILNCPTERLKASSN